MIDVSLPSSSTNILLIAPGEDRPFELGSETAADPSRFLVVRIGTPVAGSSLHDTVGMNGSVDEVAVIDASHDPPPGTSEEVTVHTEMPENLTAIGVNRTRSSPTGPSRTSRSRRGWTPCPDCFTARI